MNKGIFLDAFKTGIYTLYLKIFDDTLNTITYYQLENCTEYSDLEYYTLTRNNQNNKIDIFWNEKGLNLKVTKTKLPDNVYDIVIDQGHGGSSTGALGNGYIEAEVNYNCGIALKESLEKLGLKVLVTRDYIEQEVPSYNLDGKIGRSVIPNMVKAKYCFSVHNNSSIYPQNSGVEIYCSNNIDLTLGRYLADNIVNMASSSYSPNPVGLVKDGVYALTFDQKTIDECIQEAIDGNYEPYAMTLETPLFFMIREVGGICTGAYMDGREKSKGINPYYNSNIVAEPYLLELGYMSNNEDINNVVNNTNSYIEAITKGIKDYLGL